MRIEIYVLSVFGTVMWCLVFLRLQGGSVDTKKNVVNVVKNMRGVHNSSRHGVVTIPKKSKPIMAVCVCTRSKPDWKHFSQTAVARYLIPSLERTVTQEERDIYDMRLYICHDDDDMFWEHHKKEIQVPERLTLEVLVYKKQTKHKIPFNPFMRDVYESGAEYMTRINDDTEFVTSGWVSKAIAQLKKMNNVGVVGPTCREGNTKILTHDMVHRTHLEIFDTYYSDVFSAWYIDDWITRVYEPGRMVKMSDWVVKHHTGIHGTRYKPQMNEHGLVGDEVRKGQERLNRWLTIHGQKGVKSIIQEHVLPETINEYIHMSNVAFKNNKVHLYAPSQRIRTLLQGVKTLPPYKRWSKGEVLNDLPTPEIIIHDEYLNPKVCENGVIREEYAYFWSPWHTDNMWHLHNDNTLPLIDNILHTPGCNGLTCNMTKTLYEFEGDPERLRHEVQMVNVLRNDVFDKVQLWKDVFTGDKMICISRVSWGRGPYFFYTKQPWYVNGPASDVYPRRYWTQNSSMTIKSRAVAAIQALHKLYDIRKRSSNKTRAIYVERSGIRNIRNPDVILSACTDMGWICQRCCDWKTTTYRDTIELFSQADIIIGPHGAGLTHVLYMHSRPTLIEFGKNDDWVAEFTLMANANNGIYIREHVDAWPITVSKEQVLAIMQRVS